MKTDAGISWLLMFWIGLATWGYWRWTAPELSDWPKVLAGAAGLLAFYGLGYWRGRTKQTAQGGTVE